MNYDDACVKMNTQTVACCATCENWDNDGEIECTCKVLRGFIGFGGDGKWLPYTMAHTVCDYYKEGDHEGTEVIN